jgi:N-methylhydantoinase B
MRSRLTSSNSPSASTTPLKPDPLERDPALVVRHVDWEKVSPAAALDAYGVVLTGSVDDDSLAYDAPATTARRTELAAARAEAAFFDRGPGYAQLSGGDTSATYDWL